MPAKKQPKIKTIEAPAAPKVKKPKFKLISYTLKAVIPTGQYANIQPEITVQAKTIEAAERAVMPYIETLFAKYRDGGVKSIEEAPVRPVAPIIISKPIVMPSATPMPAPMAAQTPTPAPMTNVTPATTVAPAIVMTVPFNRAVQAINSCTSVEAVNLISVQIGKSEKLIGTEKVELKKLLEAKLKTFNDPKKV